MEFSCNFRVTSDLSEKPVGLTFQISVKKSKFPLLPFGQSKKPVLSSSEKEFKMPK